MACVVAAMRHVDRCQGLIRLIAFRNAWPMIVLRKARRDQNASHTVTEHAGKDCADPCGQSRGGEGDDHRDPNLRDRAEAYRGGADAQARSLQRTIFLGGAA